MRFKFNDAKSHFFSQPIMRKLDPAERKVLSRFGAFVRRSSRSSIRRRKKVSEPGQPPSSHNGKLKENIFFVFDPGPRSVVIGPVRLNQLSFNGDGVPTAGTIPETLEEGGAISIIEVHNKMFDKWYRKDHRYKRTDNGGQATWETRKRVVRVGARPFMQPAFKKNLPVLPDMWRNAL